ncbi:NUDIX hydrolase [Candidatus Filomicrobium marinum]|uniref:NUDIX hydrolase n=3 Tax=Filomicrobium TaxID=119044 RepID=A0A0D6J9V4_9HYPH|nr:MULTISPECIES: NUDIX domain-containing protein [Filomicrobium]CFX00371.1 NUDIX hydrolase [Candidatus Filomicrobium marinum]CPR15214.1 NUDIX hydrolase [Candidatus Filomicrobium marinum]SDO69031.1 ADP-ribose pyrophosphatase YjhB, NUDIX family [Filomicrobium insigne]
MPISWILKRARQSYWRMTRPLTIGAQGCVIAPDRRILLIRHTYRPGWHFPGGGVEKNETIETALARELKEEAGIQMTGRPQLFGIYANFRYFPSDHIALFVVREWQQPVAPKPNFEIAEHGFFPIDALPEQIHASTRARIDEIKGSVSVAELW